MIAAYYRSTEVHRRSESLPVTAGVTGSSRPGRGARGRRDRGSGNQEWRRRASSLEQTVTAHGMVTVTVTVDS